jgi:hypothetical protein
MPARDRRRARGRERVGLRPGNGDVSIAPPGEIVVT